MYKKECFSLFSLNQNKLNSEFLCGWVGGKFDSHSSWGVGIKHPFSRSHKVLGGFLGAWMMRKEIQIQSLNQPGGPISLEGG